MFMSRHNLVAVLLATAIAVPLSGCASDDYFAEAPKPYGGSKQHPIKVANGKAYVEGCGDWSENLADTASNEMAPNHGCAVQANIAAMAAYPDDLAGKKRRLPPPLGDVQYSAIQKITGDGGGSSGGSSGGSAPSSGSSTPSP